MLPLLEHDNRSVIFLFGSENYQRLYGKLKSLLSADELAIFAIPNKFSDTTRWEIQETTGTEKVAWEKLSKEDQDNLIEDLEQKKQAIIEKLLKDKEFSQNYEKFFTIVSEKSIQVVRSGNELFPVLTQWGCRGVGQNVQVDPLSMMFARPRSNRAKVVIEIYYTDGTPAAEKSFYLQYKAKKTPLKTNQEGKKDLGQFLLGSTLLVYDKQNGQIAHEHTFEVVENGRYVVHFPLFSQGILRTIDQKNSSMAEAEVQITYKGQSKDYKTNSKGELVLESLEVGQEIRISQKDNPANSQTYTIKKENNEFVLTIFRPLFANVRIEVKNDKGEMEAHFPLLIEWNGKSNEYNTGETGAVLLENLPVGTEVKITNKNRVDNFIEKRVIDGENHWILEVEKIVPRFVKVKLINHENKPLPNIPIDFSFNKQSSSQTTDQQGICIFPHENFIDQEKVKALIHLPSNNKKGEKLIKKSFLFKTDQLEYIIKLKKFNRLWLLWLLLLLPLLLLVRCEKTVCVQAINSETQNGIKNADVYFQYEKAFVYNDGEFFTSEEKVLKQKTDSLGFTCFKKLEYSIYSFIFKNTSEAFVYAVNGCYASDTLKPYFHHISNNDTLLLPLKPHLISLDFLVTDSTDNEPLPNSKVIISAEFDGKKYLDSAISQADGKVVFNNIPKCGTLKFVSASAEGYYSDKKENIEVEKLLGDVKERRNLKLKPICMPITFFVVDCQSKQPIPDATVTIDIEHAAKKKTTSVKTNVNGVGKGIYDCAHVIAEVTLSAEKKYYKKGSLPNKYKVEDFLKLPQDKRTICLEPEENCTEFKNVDEETGQPISGVKNIIKIINGSDIKTVELISNVNGIFKVCIKPGDKISIVATYPPDYEDNTDKIKDADGIKLLDGTEDDRTIPLKRIIEVEVIVTKCPNEGRPHYRLSIDGNYIRQINTSSYNNASPSPERIANLRSGTHTIKFEIIPGSKLPVCNNGTGGCTRLEIRYLNFSKNFTLDPVIIHQVVIP